MFELSTDKQASVSGGEVGATGMGGNTAYAGDYGTTITTTDGYHEFTFTLWESTGMIEIYGRVGGDSGWSSCWVTNSSKLQCASGK
jgi:hypothetical protein